jgi:alkylation response protein AidB-like acyl-CoA dehydrogenase
VVPESLGGLGLTDVDAVPLLAEFGYAAVPWPAAETLAVVAPLAAACGSGLLDGIMSGATRVALASAVPNWRAWPPQNPLRPAPADLVVPYGRDADLVLVLGDGVAHLVPATGDPVSTVDLSRTAIRIAAPTDGPLTRDAALVDLARDRATLAAAAQLVGLSRRMLELTVGYVKQRRQFGVAVGSFQAVKHHLANALLRLEFAEPPVLAAGWAAAVSSPTRAADVSTAAVLAAEAARFTARTAIQCHGAMGYTVEYELHRFAKRAWAIAAGCDVDAHLQRLGGILDDG